MRDTGPDVVETEGTQMVGYQRRGLGLAVAEFRVFVNLLANVCNLRRKPLDLAVNLGVLGARGAIDANNSTSVPTSVKMRIAAFYGERTGE